MTKKTDDASRGAGKGKRSPAAVARVHRMPGPQRAAPTEAPVALPNVPTIVHNAARAAVAVDPANRITHWNTAAIEVFGFTEDEVVGRNLQQVIQARDVHGNRLSAGYSALHEMVRIGEAPQAFELAIVTASGKMIRVAVSVVVILSAKAHDYALIYLMTPLHRRRRADEAIDRLLAMATVPGVTVPGTLVSSGAEARGSDEKPRLTRRQIEVLLLMAEGKSSDEIAEDLGISIHTVRTHTQGILKSLNATTRLEAVSRALHERLI